MAAPGSVTLTLPCRPRAGSLGLAELLAGEPGSAEEQWALQREDLGAVGRLLLVLACAGSPVASLEAAAAACTAELTRLLGALLDAPAGGSLQSWRQARDAGRRAVRGACGDTLQKSASAAADVTVRNERPCVHGCQSRPPQVRAPARQRPPQAQRLTYRARLRAGARPRSWPARWATRW